MAHPDTTEKALREELARLGLELEQARVSLEDAHGEVATLTADCQRLQGAVATLEQARSRADAEASNARRKAAATAVLVSNALQQTDVSEDLRTALEETSVLAEELQATNEELIAANEQLDQHVAERTAELGRANSQLELVNAELSRRVEAETAARLKAQAELFQLQKLDAIGQLTGGIAHDFNNLLMVIINGLHVLAQPHDTPQRQRALRRTQEASWRAAELTRRLLAFARRQALQPERVDLRLQMSNLRELIGQGLRENIQISTNVVPDLWPLEADLGALELALLNLAVNARDAMPSGGGLTVTACNAVVDVGRARQLSLRPGDYIAITVVDTGIGMPPEIVEKAFEPFFTTKGAGKGTGLGLSQVYGFVQQSGGTATVESRIGEGTAVRLLLPRSSRAVERGADRPRLPVPAHARENLRVLVVEDDPAVATVVVDMLAQLGHRGSCVGTVASALAHLNDSAEIDLVLSDVLLPGGDSGVDLAREMRRRSLPVPIVLTSGYGGSMTHRLSTMNLPFLRKPYELQTLNQVIDEAFATDAAAAPGA
jgi:signal transduction histidine kinase/CheY-like chemotaxis protein